MKRLFAILLGLLVSSNSWAQAGIDPSKDIQVHQLIGDGVAASVPFVDDKGETVTLGKMGSDRPTVLVMVYYECPMLCGLVLQGLVGALKAMTLVPGEDFDVVVVSIDPGDKPKMSAIKKRNTLAVYGKPETADGWHFLTGSEASIKALADSIGFQYKYDETRDEYAHAALATLLTPDGTISRYFFGIEFSPRDLRLGLVEASNGAVGNAVDAVLLYCFHYDPTTGKYSMVVLNSIRVLGVGTLALMAFFIGGYLLRDRRMRRALRPASS